MKIAPYLNFDGNCREAFNTYAGILGGKIIAMSTFADMPADADIPDDYRDAILHARLEVGDNVLMASDAPGGRYSKPVGFCVQMEIDDPEEAERVFDALAKDGSVQMAFGPTFWGEKFGMCTDRFSIPWMINCRIKY